MMSIYAIECSIISNDVNFLEDRNDDSVVIEMQDNIHENVDGVLTDVLPDYHIPAK